MAFAIVACNKISEEEFIPLQPDVPSVVKGGIYITAKLESKTPITRAVALEGDEIAVTWAVDEHIAILYEVNSVKKMADATVTAVDGETGAATISFTVDGETSDDTPCTLVYPASAAKADKSGVKTFADLLSAQDGTLNANLDVRVGVGTIQTETPGLTVTTKPAAQYSIFNFTLTMDGSTPISARGFVVRDGSDNLITAVSPESATSTFFVAIPAKSAGTGFKFVAADGTKKYSRSLSLVSNTESGVYYQVPLNMGAGESLPVTNLAGIHAAYTASDFETLTGTLGDNVKISVEDGATVTLQNATINGVNDNSYIWAGITCMGDATIILSGTNTIQGFRYSAGIYVPSGSTLTIKGTDTDYLTASSIYFGAGIGGDYSHNCGNIVIDGGNVTATAHYYCAGIGGYRGGSKTCGYITINGGIITANAGNESSAIGGHGADCNITINGGTVTANGGYYTGIGAGIASHCGDITINGGTVTATAAFGAAIGCNYSSSSCGDISINGGTVFATGGYSGAGIGSSGGTIGDISISSGVTSVTATKGSSATNSIGLGDGGTCGPVTIGGLVLWDGSAYQNGGGDYLPASSLVYIPSTPSAFSVSSNQKVFFSPGNLQCIPNTRAWRFAENQWGYIGVGGPSEPGNAHRMWEGDSYTDWYDIFGWGTWTGSSPNPAKADQYNTSYAWGDGDFTEESLLANAPLPGKNWRTLSQTEWAYLFNTRETTSGVRYAKATVNSVEGVILLPDDWSTSYHSLASTNTAEAAYTANEISAAAWMIDFEAHGAIFLPVATIHYYGSGPELLHTGNYWSSTPYSETKAYCVNFSSSTLSASYTHDRSTAISVRLVYDLN